MTIGRLLYIARYYACFGIRYWYAEQILTPRIKGWGLSEQMPNASVPVHLLASERDWIMSLWMLASLHWCSERHWSIVIHEDGTLPAEAPGIFQELFNDVHIVRRVEADSLIVDLLATRPRCAAYRREMPHALKCFDVPHLAATDRFLLLDPDVLFFTRPHELLRWVDDREDHSCWFNEDAQEPSPISPDEAEADLGVRLWPKVNSGLCALTRAAIDFDRMEEWLAHPKIAAGNPWRTEQTLLALSGSAWGRGGLLPASYEVSLGRNRNAAGVARHYVGAVRDRFYSEGVAELAPRLLQRNAKGPKRCAAGDS